MELYCEYSRSSWAGIGIVYTCKVTTANITDRVTVKTFKGAHQKGYNDNHVEALRFVNSTLHFLPTGFNKIFPNLKGLSVFNSGMKEIVSSDLIGLEKLVELSIYGNQLTKLPSDLFVNLKELKWIDFCNNKLQCMSSQVLATVSEKNLLCVDFRSNEKFDAYFIHTSGVGLNTLDELRASIDKSNDTTAEDVDSDKVSSSEDSTDEDDDEVEDTQKGEIVEMKQRMLSGFKDLWNNTKFSDLTIVVDSKEIRVHKNVLACRSPVLASILTSDEPMNSCPIEIKDCSASTVEDFLYCLYTGEIPNEGKALEIFAYASELKIEMMREVCEAIALRDLNNATALQAFLLGSRYNSMKLAETAFEKLKKIHKDIQLSDDIKTKPENVQQMIQLKKDFDEKMTKLRAGYDVSSEC